MDLRQRLQESIGQLPQEQQGVATRIMTAFPDEDLEALAALVDSPSFGWEYVVESFMTKTKALLDGDDAALQAAQKDEEARFAQVNA